MEHIFYIIGIFFVLYEMGYVLAPEDRIKSIDRYKELSKAHKGKKWDEYSEEFKGMCRTKIPSILTIVIWLILGLFTYNWFGFLLLLVFNICVIKPLNKLFENTYGKIIITFINSLIGLGFGIFVIINKYHLRIDLYELFFGLFK